MKYKVEITETLQMNVEVEADSLEEAEQLVNDKWYKGEYILGADNFIDVDFEAEEIKPEKIKVVLLEPNKLARVAEIGTSLEDLQKIVGGCIETFYPFEDDICIVCNDEGKINGMPLNRGVYEKDNTLIDILAGPVFICDCSTPSFKSLPKEKLDKYMKLFKYPERFIRVNDEIKGIKFNPNKDRER